MRTLPFVAAPALLTALLLGCGGSTPAAMAPAAPEPPTGAAAQPMQPEFDAPRSEGGASTAAREKTEEAAPGASLAAPADAAPAPPAPLAPPPAAAPALQSARADAASKPEARVA
ncbi:MAG TPA: VWA domain-containing protein, partial [Sorangium sp.]|nr:VWA domain-containing protein [Sorangium sp.]